MARQPLHTGWRALGSLRLACLGGIARLDGLGGLLLDSPRERIGDARDEREEREAWWLYLSTHRRLAALGCH